MPRHISQTLNEGRSLNSGDTIYGSTALDWRGVAQRRPESELRRHTSAGGRRTPVRSTLNEGRSLNSGDTADVHLVGVRGLTRSTKAGV